MTEPTAYCRECGDTLSANATTCPACGAPQSDSGGHGKLALFVSILSAFVGLFAFGIVFGPIAAIAAFVASQRLSGWLGTFGGVVCVVGVLEAVAVAVWLFMLYGGL